MLKSHDFLKGFDKNAECMQSMLSTGLGFGFVEVGSITPVPQPGNPLPRVFRLSKDLAIINRYGFNSDGIESVSKNLHSYRENQCKITERSPQGFVGVNLGKNKETKEALLDYLFGIKALTQYADYMVINVSSPNTPGLRLLQGRKELHYLLAGVKKELQEVVGKPDYLSKSNNSSEKYSPPLLVKISPDMSDSELADVAAISLELKIDGIIISNTTINERENLLEKDLSNETGGLSGKPLLNRSNEALSKMYLLTKGKIPLIGVGGITTADDVYLKMKLGASLVQLYTSLIYEGPGLPANLKEDLIKLVKQDGFSNIEEVVGIAHKKK
jgi:dihydroorotate dehydrogenase